MKKIIQFILLAVISLSLFGCTGEELFENNLAPVIQSESYYEVGLNDEEFDLTSLIYVLDDFDGGYYIDSDDIDYKDFDITSEGEYQVSLSVTDSMGETTYKTITLSVIDKSIPRVELIGSENITVIVGTDYNDVGVNVTSELEYVLSVIGVNNVDTTVTGEYTIEYYVNDSSGKKSESVFRTVTVVDAIDSIELDVTVDGTVANFEIDVVDNDTFGEIVSIELFYGDLLIKVIQNLYERDVDTSVENCTYTLKVTYTYLLPDGVTYIELSVSEEYTTISNSELDENGLYISKDEVALYIYLYGELPSNYMTKSEAGSHISNHWTSANMASIGGDRFGNYEGLLPSGKTYYEVDINYHGSSSRGSERIVYSSDGFIFYTGDHYGSFKLYDPITKDWVNYSKNDDMFD